LKRTLIMMLSTAALLLAANEPTPTSTSITIKPGTTVAVGDSASAVGNTTSGGVAVADGKLELQAAADATGNRTSCNANTQFLSGTPNDVDSNGSATFSLDTSTAGTFGYRVHYLNGEPTYGNSFSPCVDLTVTPTACTGVTISTDIAGGNGTPSAPGTYTWLVDIKVHACEAATGLKIQGGSNSWATNAFGAPSAGTITAMKTPGKSSNTVATWNIDSLSAGDDATLTLTVTGTIKPNTASGTVLGLLGQWSVVYSTDGGATYQRYDAPGTVTVTVQ